MENSMLKFTFSVFFSEDTLFWQIFSKNQNCQFKLKLDTSIPGQNIWNKVERSGKTGQEKKSLLSIFASFLLLLSMPNFMNEDWPLGYLSTQTSFF